MRSWNNCGCEWRHMIAVAMNITTKRLIIHEAESTRKYHHKHPLEIRSTRKKNWNKRLRKHLGNLKKTLVKTSDYFTVASCPPMPRPRAHAPNKQGGKPAGQDTSSYRGRKICNKVWLIFIYHVFQGTVILFVSCMKRYLQSRHKGLFSNSCQRCGFF